MLTDQLCTNIFQTVKMALIQELSISVFFPAIFQALFNSCHNIFIDFALSLHFRKSQLYALNAGLLIQFFLFLLTAKLNLKQTHLRKDICSINKNLMEKKKASFTVANKIEKTKPYLASFGIIQVFLAFNLVFLSIYLQKKIRQSVYNFICSFLSIINGNMVLRRLLDLLNLT